jgi:hypothetical protein
MSDTPQAAPANDTPRQRESNGRFAPGNSGGPGNPFGRQVAELRQTLLDVATPDKLRKLVDALIERAIHGDTAAAKLVLQYTLGKPAAAVDPDRIDFDEYRLLKDSAVPVTEWMSVIDAMPVNVVNDIADAFVPPVAQLKKKLFAESLKPRENTREGRRAERKAQKRFYRTMGLPVPPSANGSDGRRSKLQFDRHGFLLDMGFGPDRAG